MTRSAAGLSSLARAALAGLSLAIILPAGRAAQAATLAESIRQATGSPTRLAWVRDGTKLVLFDTEDPRGEVEIAFPSRINRPVITPSGKQVIVIAFEQWSSLILDWGKPAKDARKLVDGRVTSARLEGGAELIYFQTPTNEFRVAPLADPGKSTLVWKLPVKARANKTENFQTSADGKFAASGCPWPAIGVARLPQAPGADMTLIGQGCWSQIARDNSYRVFHCTDGSHTRLGLFDLNTRKYWYVPIHPNPRRGGAECPRWAHDPRFIICTDRPARQTGVYLGKFNPEFTELGDWLTVSSKGANSEAEIWIESSATRVAAAATGEPRELTPIKAPIARSVRTLAAWPVSAEGLVFVWENGQKQASVAGTDGKPVRVITSQRGTSRPTYFGAIDLTGGSLLAEGIEDLLLEGCRKSHGFTLEATIRPAENDFKDGVIASFAPENLEGAERPQGASPNFLLAQREGQLVLTVRTTEGGKSQDRTATLMPLQAGRLHHLIITCAGGQAVAYLNGREAGKAAVPGDFSGWQPGRLIFGDVGEQNRGWNGRVEGLAVFARALSGADAAREAAAMAPRLRRTLPTQYTVEAKLVGTTPTPDVAAIAPYTRSMVTDFFEITKVTAGRLDAKKIQVARWAIIGGKPVPSGRKVGESCTLTLEALEENPHLKAERLDSDAEDPDLPVFVESLR